MNKKTKVLFLLHSDFGVAGTIGARAPSLIEKVYKDFSKDIKVLSRGSNPIYLNKYNIKKISKINRFVQKGITASDMVFDSRVLKVLKQKLISRNFSKMLTKEDLSGNLIVHSWEFMPELFKNIKYKNPNSIIIQEVPIALASILKGIKDKELLWGNKDLTVLPHIKEAFKYIDYFIVPSSFTKDSLTNEGINNNKIFQIQWGVDSNKFKPNLKLKNKNEFNVAFTGNVNNRKGVPYLIEAWKEFNKKGTRLNIYGRLYPEARKYFKDANKYNIKLHGFVDISKELPRNDVFILPSLLEGSSKATLEAMACGIPGIVTYNSGSVIEDSKEGFIIPIQNPKEIKNKLEKLYKDKKLLSKLSKNAREKAKKYGPDLYSSSVIEVYKKCLKKN